MIFQNLLRYKIVYSFMAIWMFLLSGVPSNSSAIVMDSYSYLKQDTRQKDLDRIKQFISLHIVKVKLSKFGISEQRILARLDKLTDEQIHYLANRIDTIKSGGDATGFIIGILLIVVLILLILYLTDYQVKIEKKHK